MPSTACFVCVHMKRPESLRMTDQSSNTGTGTIAAINKQSINFTYLK